MVVNHPLPEGDDFFPYNPESVLTLFVHRTGQRRGR